MDAAVLAAGRGSRMGAPKHLLEIDGVSMLERVVRALRDSRAGRITVVLRIGDDPGRVLAEALGVPWTLAAEPQRGPHFESLLIKMISVPFQGHLFLLGTFC